ncbi:hypothetical protein PoB_007626200 [Plakobranchus ocellatus]|uniref:Uncharacterized protein n=1 Tax=Plakobranchus ocellatus TaxID=259542 RepID=A0AAV4DZG9_9GAST|nr:hypothetical protein PoB_007626200 [Plakobranchus ocellatus]
MRAYYGLPCGNPLRRLLRVFNNDCTKQQKIARRTACNSIHRLASEQACVFCTWPFSIGKFRMFLVSHAQLRVPPDVLYRVSVAIYEMTRLLRQATSIALTLWPCFLPSVDSSIGQYNPGIEINGFYNSNALPYFLSAVDSSNGQ